MKHGVHTQFWLRENGRCRKDRVAFVLPVMDLDREQLQQFESRSHTRALSVPEFVGHPHTYKALPVRGQLSYFKSLYNYVCNDHTKAAGRALRGINCSKRNEFAHLQSIGFQEMATYVNPNRIRDLVVQAGPKHLLFYDYAALGDLIAPFCENGLENAGVAQMNSASAQGYEDFWDAQNVSTWHAGSSKFWDDMSVQLKRDKCLHFEEKKGAVQ